MSDIRPSNLPIEETDLIGFVHTDRGIDGSAKFNLANVSSALNLDGMATQAPSNVAITGGSITGITDLAVADGGTGASTLTGYVKGAGTAALTASATIPNTDITGLGTMSTQDAATVNIDGGAIDGTTIGATTPSTGAFTTLSATSGRFTGASSPVANSLIADFSTTSRLIACGPNNSTQGELGIYTITADGSAASLPAVFSSTGLAVTGALSSTTGANFATSSGNVGIGTSSPSAKFHVANDGAGEADVARFSRTNSADLGFLDIGVDPDSNLVIFDASGSVAQSYVFRTGGTERLRLDSSGNVGIGTATPVTLKSATTIQVNGNAKLGNANDRGLLSLGDTGSTEANVGVWRGAAGAYGGAGNYLSLGGYDGITLTTGNADIASQTERMRIDTSGNVGIGTTSPAQKLDVNGNVAVTGQTKSTSASSGTGSFESNNLGASGDRFHMVFRESGTERGSITSNGSATAYNTSSDARLKTNIRDYLPGDLIDSLQPRIFDWKTGEKDTIGFVAQELHAVYPQAVSAGDDGEEVTRSWGVDFSKLVPVLVAEVKSLRARVAALES